jgi:hypothetical protein
MILAPVAAYLLASEGIKKMAAALPEAKTNTTTQWSILIFIFLPVMAGLFIFGMYAAKGEFEDAIAE